MINLQRIPATATGSGPHDRRAVRRFGRPVGSMLVAVLAAGALVASCGGSDAENSTDETGGDTAGAALELSLGESNAMASCLPVDAATLSQMEPAFQGTVTGIEGETITLDVDTWYAGAVPASTVKLNAEQGLEALIGGIDFQVGEPYFITAANGTVNYCGYSGPADPTLTALFDEAFAG